MQAEDDELDDEDWHVRHRDGGHLIAAEKSHHERIEKAERRGDQILHDDRQRQQKKTAVRPSNIKKTASFSLVRVFFISSVPP